MVEDQGETEWRELLPVTLASLIFEKSVYYYHK